MEDASDICAQTMREQDMSDIAVAQFNSMYGDWLEETNRTGVTENTSLSATGNDAGSETRTQDGEGTQNAATDISGGAASSTTDGTTDDAATEPAACMASSTENQPKSPSEDAASWILESDIEPLTDVPSFHDIYDTIDHDQAVHAFAKTAFLKLNGGLGTSMGLDSAKSLLPVRRHKARRMRFIDIILGQITTARDRLDVPLPLTFMNSFRTSGDTKQVLARNHNFHQDDIPVEIMQHQEPKIDLATGKPVRFPANPALEWCPPGHGDLFSTIWESGLLDKLQEQGFSYLFISNSDNLGARPSRTLAQYFENTGTPFMVEVANRTEADRKGGHFVRNKRTGRLMLREMTQVADGDKDAAQDIMRHPYFNTNSIWVRIDALKAKLEEHGGILPLPVIRNYKTVDPTDPSTTPVVQLETAMGAAVGLFDGAICVQVDRMRFLPVKTTNDLFIMRSDRFHLTDSYEMEDGDYRFPAVSLDARFYKNIDDFNERFPYSVPSLAAANSVTVRGDWTFGQNVSFYGDAVLDDQGKPSYVPNGAFVGPQGIEPDMWK